MALSISTMTVRDGTSLSYRSWGDEGRATILLLHGVMSHSEWLAPIAERLAPRRLRVIAPDRRGSGLSSGPRGDAPSAKALLDDVLAILEKERRPGPLFLAGWCWGGVLAINLATELDASGVILLAPGLYSTKLLEDRMAKAKEAAAGRAEDEACLESPIDEALFTRGPALESFILRDPLRVRAFTPRFSSIMVKLGMGALTKLPRLRRPILTVLAEGDRATDNGRTVVALSKLGGLELQTVPGEHGLQFEAPEEVVARVISWIDRR
jgi:acylglycerol lipase